MDDKTRTELEAAAFRGLVEHLQRRSDVQNIDLMNLAGFCRNCLSKWYLGAAKDGMASGTGGMITRDTNQAGALYLEGTFSNGLPDGALRVEEPGRKPRTREFRAGKDVGSASENQLKRLTF